MQVEILSRFVLCFLLQTEDVNVDDALTKHAHTQKKKQQTDIQTQNEERNGVVVVTQNLMLLDPSPSSSTLFKNPFCIVIKDKKRRRHFFLCVIFFLFRYPFLLFALYMWINSVIDEQKEIICWLAVTGVSTQLRENEKKRKKSTKVRLGSARGIIVKQIAQRSAIHGGHKTRQALFSFGMTNPARVTLRRGRRPHAVFLIAICVRARVRLLFFLLSFFRLYLCGNQQARNTPRQQL